MSNTDTAQSQTNPQKFAMERIAKDLGVDKAGGDDENADSKQDALLLAFPYILPLSIL